MTAQEAAWVIPAATTLLSAIVGGAVLLWRTGGRAAPPEGSECGPSAPDEVQFSSSSFGILRVEWLHRGEAWTVLCRFNGHELQLSIQPPEQP